MPFDIDEACRPLIEAHLLPRDAGDTRTAAAGRLGTWTRAHAALVARHVDPSRACRELADAYERCQLPSGLVVRSDPSAPDGASHGLLDPPFAAYVVARLALDSQLLDDDLLESATRQVDAIWEERLPPDTCLPVILHPAESGTPHSPCFAPLIESPPGPEWEDEVATLARSAVGCQLEPARALRAGHPFVVEDPAFCGWLLIAFEELGKAWDQRGSSPAALRLRVRSQMVRDAIEERLWWPAEEIYTAFDRGRGEPLRAVGAGGLVPVASRTLLAEGNAKRAVDRYLRPSGSPLWGALGLLAEPLRGAPGDPRDQDHAGISPLYHYWAHLALVRAGRGSDARVARSQLEALVEAHGSHDAYDPVAGVGRDGQGSLLGALLLEMSSAD